MEVAAAAGALAVTLLFAMWLEFHLGGNRGVHRFDDIVTALAALTACLACLAAAKRSSQAMRRFWGLIGLALVAWTSAEVIWAIYDLALRVPVPVPSWADVGYLGAIPLAAAALLCHPGMHVAGTHKARATLDGLAIGTALLLLSWTFVLGPLWRHTDLTSSGGIVALAYPFGDLVILFLVVLSVRPPLKRAAELCCGCSSGCSPWPSPTAPTPICWKQAAMRPGTSSTQDGCSVISPSRWALRARAASKCG